MPNPAREDDTTRIDAGDIASDFGEPIKRDSGAILIDPDTIGRPIGYTSGSGGSDSGSGDAGDDGSDFGDGYGSAGKYGKGRFPDGTSRKRIARGGDASGNGRSESGTQAVSSGAPRKGRSKPLDPHGVEVVLVSIHAGLSALLEKSIPDDEKVLLLAGEDAKRLAVAAANVARHYPSLELSGKVFDHYQLITVSASIYGPMAALLYLQRAERKEAALQAARARMAPVFTPDNLSDG